MQAVQLAPSWPAGHLTLAAAARNCGLLEPAAAALRTALQLLPVQAQQRDEAGQAQQQRDERYGSFTRCCCFRSNSWHAT